MPITLQQAKALSNDKLTHYVIDEFTQSALIDLMPFDNAVKPQGGTSLTYTYNRLKTQPTAAARALNAEYVPQEADTEPVSVNLKIFGGSFQVDRVVQKDETEAVDLVQFQLQQKIKAARALFHDWFINGDAGADPLAFDGLDKTVAGGPTELIPDEAIDLSTPAMIDTNWKMFLDTLRRLRAKLDGAPTLYLMNGDLFSVFQSVMDRAGMNLASKTNYGDEVLQWGGSMVMALGDKPGGATPIIGTAGDGTTCVYPVRLGLDGVHGVSPTGSKVIDTYLPDLSAPGAVKTGEVEMVAAVAIKAVKAAGVLRGVKI